MQQARSLLHLVQARHVVAQTGGDEFELRAFYLIAVEGNRLKAMVASAPVAAGICPVIPGLIRDNCIAPWQTRKGSLHA